MRTLPLVKAHLKGFLRNWKSVLLLLGVPLLLVTLIVASFNTQGLTGVPFGVVEQNEFDIFTYQDSYLSYLQLTSYPTIQACLDHVAKYREYGCIDVDRQGTKTFIVVHFDNTQEPIIWEVLQRLETSVEILSQQQSEQAINLLLQETSSTQESFDVLETGITDTSKTLNNYETQLITMRSRLLTIRSDLQTNIQETQRELVELQGEVNEIERQRRDAYTTSNNLISQARQVENSLPPGEEREELSNIINGFSNEVHTHDQKARSSITRAENTLQRYQEANQQARTYVQELESASNQLQQARLGVLNQKQAITGYQREIQSVSEQLQTVGNTSTDALLNSLAITTTPTFVPQFDIPESINLEEVAAEQINQAQSLISLQTLYPTILLLILLFLSLLTASFLCLQEINSAASSRIRLIPNMFSAELLATYCSTLTIVAIPVLCVLIAGEYLFSLRILVAAPAVLTTLFLLTTAFIFFGMIIAYTLRKESTTLLLSTLLLVFFMFFSGFLYPIERMNDFFALIATSLPPKIGLDAFNQAVFYGQTQLTNEITLLFSWALVLGITAAVIKYQKRQ